MGHEIYSSRRPPPSEGHFRADPAHWMIVLALNYSLHDRRTIVKSHLLIPHATLSAQIRAAETRRRDSKELALDVAPVLVPWQDWGPHGCLRLRLRCAPIGGFLRLVPYGSRMPFALFAPPTLENRSVFVFDVNPLVARHARQSISTRRDGSMATTIVEDVEEVLPGIVDPECSTIPYVVYRFDLPDELQMRSVVMSMTGFMVLVSISVHSSPSLPC